MTIQPQIDLSEFKKQKALLFSKLGETGSGYARYSAAMYFHEQGIIPLDLLEIYRRCCKFDNENPIELAKHEGVKILRESSIIVRETMPQ